jgi:hypothetical protein
MVSHISFQIIVGMHHASSKYDATYIVRIIYIWGK